MMKLWNQRPKLTLVPRYILLDYNGTLTNLALSISLGISSDSWIHVIVINAYFVFSVGLMCVYSTVYCHSKLERLNLILNPQNSRTWIEYQSSSRVIWVSSQVDQVLSRGDKEFICQMLKIYQAMFASVKCSQTQNTFLLFSHEYSFSLCWCSIWLWYNA